MAGRPGHIAGQRAGVAVAGGIGGGSAGALVEIPVAEQAGVQRTRRGAVEKSDLPRAERAVVDAGIVDVAVEAVRAVGVIADEQRRGLIGKNVTESASIQCGRWTPLM
jgi:hypothetical protein